MKERVALAEPGVSWKGGRREEEDGGKGREGGERGERRGVRAYCEDAAALHHHVFNPTSRSEPRTPPRYLPSFPNFPDKNFSRWVSPTAP